MCPRRNSARRIYDSSRSPQRGFALVSAIFLLVVLAALGAFMVTLSTVQNVTSTQDLQGSRAYQAARAGIEWGAYQVRTPEHTNLPTGQAPYICPTAATTLNHLAGSLAGFSVQVLCVETTYGEGGNTIAVYQLTSTATLGTVGSTNYVERQLSAAISTCRAAGVPCPE
ncbi:MAG: hypothetical protein HHJ09_08600 [Glaciimonas sp.]|nr:hypothetical protein [Glaciimonas sp.]